MKESLTMRDQEEQLNTHHNKKAFDVVVLQPLIMMLIKFFPSVNLI
jgi:hypothetical protein